jgi:hypothetical protein
MDGKRFAIQELLYGSDGDNLYLRVDFEPGAVAELEGMEAHLTIQASADQALASFVVLAFRDGVAKPSEVRLAKGNDPAAAEFAFRKILEARVALAALGVGRGQSLRLQLSLWKQGLPVDATPQEGWLEISTAEPTDWPL